MRHVALTLVVVSAFTTTFLGAARAEGPKGDAALAEIRFQEGRQLMARGKTAEACAKLAESQRLEPATGTLLNLAACHEAEGKLATAWAELNEAVPRARVDGRADREAYAKQKIAEIEPRLSRLTITVDAAPQANQLLVTLDGVPVGPATWGVATPVDPGPHEVRATAPGKAEWKKRVEVSSKNRDIKVEVPVRGNEGPAASPVVEEITLAPSAPPPSAPVVATPVPPSPHEERSHVRRNAGIVLLVVGAASVATGTVFGLRTFNFWQQRQEACPRDMCKPQAVQAYDNARTSAKISNVAFAAGLTTAVLGTYLIFTVPERQTAQSAGARIALLPVIGPKSGGVEVACHF